MQNSVNKHIPVLLSELTESIKIDKNKRDIIVDCTLGAGGHARKVIQKMKKGDIFIGFDADKENLNSTKHVLHDIIENHNIDAYFIHSNFLHLRSELKKKGVEKVTGIYYDLGLSSMQVDEADRGFSFKNDGPLDMRFNKSEGESAYEVVNFYDKNSLINIFREYGEEPAARKIAEKIVEERKRNKITSTRELCDVITSVANSLKAKTRIFQAIRMQVNNEIENTRISVQDAIDLLEPEGNIFVITFHSLEDRLVKNILRDESKDCICNDLICTCHHVRQLTLLTKKPIIPSNEEIKTNPRSRSAKGRLAQKL